MLITPVNDLQLAAVQCLLQRAVKPLDIIGFYGTMRNARKVAKVPDYFSPTLMLGKIQEWAEVIDPRNTAGYRKVPVYFKGGMQALKHNLIPRAMISFATVYVNEGFETPTEAYKEFEVIHPYIDGNGRIGHLLWAVYTCWQTKEWPMTLPPCLW